MRPYDRDQRPIVHQSADFAAGAFLFLAEKLGAMNHVELSGNLCRLRPYRRGDEAAICAVADDFMVARWMTRAFPHPYTRADAEQWIGMACRHRANSHFAIEVQGVLAGGVGFDPFGGERTGTASFGYWLGRAYWGQGIATEAARMLADHALHTSELRRLEAKVFEPNVASARVLQKAGFSLEGVLQSAYIDRDDKICNALLFARTTTKKADSVSEAVPRR
jgi:[ribosomal protein S5]-alanine N-acetyltransferase